MSEWNYIFIPDKKKYVLFQDSGTRPSPNALIQHVQNESSKCDVNKKKKKIENNEHISVIFHWH